MDPLNAALSASASGMRAQALRLRVVSENMANQNNAALDPTQDPYRRKTIHFKNVLDRNLGVELVEVSRVDSDPTPFPLRYEPNHPGADANGYVKYTNVRGLIEIADMRQANRSYQAQLNVFSLTRQMQSRTNELLR